MPMYVFWDDADHSIIRTESEGRWTWDEYHVALDQILKMIQTVDHRVDLINLPRPDALPPTGNPQPHYERALRMLPPNVGVNIIISQSLMGRMLVSLWSKMPGNKLGSAIKLVENLEAAHAFIAQDRAKTPPVE